ncbi:MAG: C10 family peptidase [Muribaculaceae bacterium]|nr:C10 family peptidase [Muribaculaceae bacterium]
MKKILLLLTAATIALQLTAATVDLATAKTTAEQYMRNRVYSGKFMAPGAATATLLKTEMGDINKTAPVYYIFNTATSFVIVAGDDRAEEVLAYGDRPLNLDLMPDNMKAWLGTYKEQIDYLISHPDLKVEKSTKLHAPALNATSVEPLLTAIWDQEAPFYNQCKFGSYQCLTGCPATSASMVFYYWKYPTDPTPVVPGYESIIEYGSSWWGGSQYVNYNHSALPSVTFDWDNMIDDYRGSYTTAQGDAVATLMRYVGQAERMAYGTYAAGGSGVDADSVCNIADAFKFFGYDENTVRFVKKTSAYSGGTTLYSDTQWAAMIQEELMENRPIVYCAISYDGGHAFNVDGYNASTSMYHINWGWSGEGNTFCKLNAFSDGGSTFNQYQQMVIGIQPPPQGPMVKASVKSLDMACYTGETATATFTVTGQQLSENVSITLSDESGAFAVSPTSVSLADAEAGKTVTVTFAPEHYGIHNATLILTSGDAIEATVALTGEASLEKGSLSLLEAADVKSTSFRAEWTDRTPAANVASYTLLVSEGGFEEAELVAQADFTSITSSQSTPIADLDAYCSPAGWTGTVYPTKGGARLGRNSSDNVSTLTTPQLDFRRTGGKITIVVTANSYVQGGGSSFGSGSLVIKTGSHTYTQALTTASKTYTIMLDCDEFKDQTVSFTSSGMRVLLSTISITTTDTTKPKLNAAVEQGDDSYRTITGITGLNYTVGGLLPETSYFYKVKAIYIDGSESNWTASREVILLPASQLEKGDLNADGTVDVTDVNILINIVLGNAQAGDYDGRALITDDEDIDVSDVNALINIILSKN